MTEAEDSRKRVIDETAGTVDRHRSRSFEYEEKAIEFANSSFRALTYLNGGALVAIPTAVALFKVDIDRGKVFLTAAVLMFVAGLIFVILAQGAAFFTMARRSESEQFFSFEQVVVINLRYYVTDPAEREKSIKEMKGYNDIGRTKISRSNNWRLFGLALFWLSLASFLIGCYLGARAVLG